MPAFSTSNLSGFYEIAALKALLMKLAALSIILEEDEDFRYHRYLKNWKPNTDLAIIDNGAGDIMHIMIAPEGVVIKGFDHVSEVSPYNNSESNGTLKVWKGMFDGIPPELDRLLDELAEWDESYTKEETTFCIWRRAADDQWSIGKVEFPNEEDDGSEFLLGTIFPDAESFKEWADDYYEEEMPLSPITAVYQNQPLTDEMILEISPECDASMVQLALKELWGNEDK